MVEFCYYILFRSAEGLFSAPSYLYQALAHRLYHTPVTPPLHTYTSYERRLAALEDSQ